MSAALVTGAQAPSISLCTQCCCTIPRSDTGRSRHAAPCSHVICGKCVERISSEQKSRQVRCAAAACGCVFTSTSDWPVALCTGRPQRILNERERRLGDQGNAGDDPLAVVTNAAANGARADEKNGQMQCEKHLGERVEFVEISSGEMRCRLCIAPTEATTEPPTVRTLADALAAAEAAGQVTAERARALAEQIRRDCLPLDAAQEKVKEWYAEQVISIREWEATEIARIRTVANDSCKLVSEFQEQRLSQLPYVLLRRASACATLKEYRHELRNLSTDPAARLKRHNDLLADLNQLISMLEGGALRAPAASEVTAWCSPPTLAPLFGRTEEEREAREEPAAEEKKSYRVLGLGTLAAGLWTTAQNCLAEYRAQVPVDDAICRVVPRFERALAETPRVVSNHARHTSLVSKMSFASGPVCSRCRADSATLTSSLSRTPLADPPPPHRSRRMRPGTSVLGKATESRVWPQRPATVRHSSSCPRED